MQIFGIQFSGSCGNICRGSVQIVYRPGRMGTAHGAGRARADAIDIRGPSRQAAARALLPKVRATDAWAPIKSVPPLICPSSAGDGENRWPDMARKRSTAQRPHLQ